MATKFYAGKASKAMIDNTTKAELRLNNDLTRFAMLNNEQIDVGRMIGDDFFVDHVLSRDDAMKQSANTLIRSKSHERKIGPSHAYQKRYCQIRRPPTRSNVACQGFSKT